MTTKRILEQLIPATWDSQKPAAGSGTERVRYMQQIDDLLHRPVINRATGSTNASAVNCTGAVQSSGIAIASPLKPMRYGEFTVKARVTFTINSVGPAYIYVLRTVGATPAEVAIPAAGSAPNPGDATVGGDAFMGGPTVNGVSQCGAFSFLDSGLDKTKYYAYYLAVLGQNGNVLNLINSSQVLAMERS